MAKLRSTDVTTEEDERRGGPDHPVRLRVQGSGTGVTWHQRDSGEAEWEGIHGDSLYILTLL